MQKKARAEFSIFIRKRGSDGAGYNKCISCGVSQYWKEMNAGHLHHNRLDFDEMNLNPQCVRCNKWLHGNAAPYTLKLIEIHGLKKVQDLEKRAKLQTSEKYHYLDLEYIYLKYKKINERV